MKTYCVIVTDDAKADLKRYRDYILNNFKNPQAAKALIFDFRETRRKLETISASLQDPESEVLRQRGLKKINFQRHNYFLLFRIVGDRVYVTNVFHFLEDYENKLK